MENVMIEAVLQEILTEQKETIQQLDKMQAKMETLVNKLYDSNNSLQNQNQITPTINLQPLQDWIAREIADIKTIIKNQPANILHQKRVLLFPEHNPGAYYDAVFRWILYALIALLCFCLLAMLIDKWK